MTRQTTVADYQNSIHRSAIMALLDHYARDPMDGGEPLNDLARQNLVGGLAGVDGAFSVLSLDADTPVGQGPVLGKAA